MPVKIVAAGGLVTNENNELMMIFRRGKWDLPKGKLDDGESIEECALREVEEETGINELLLGELVGKTLHEYFDRYINEVVLKETYWYAMKVKGNPLPTPQVEEHIEKIIWANEDDLQACLKNTYQNIIDIVQQFKEKLISQL